MRRCLVCDIPIDDKRADARTCSDRCRKTAHRHGLSHPIIGEKIQPVSIPAKLRKPSTEDVVRLVVSANSLEASFRFASQKADFRLRPLCARMADAIGAALDEEGLR